MLQELEECLLHGMSSRPAVEKLIQTSNENTLAQFVLAILDCNVTELITAKIADYFPSSSLDKDIAEVLSTNTSSLITKAAGNTTAEYEIYLFGVACLNLYVRANYTGPPPNLKSIYSKINVEEDQKDQYVLFNKRCVQVLSIEGEDFCSVTHHPFLLCVARSILVHHYESFASKYAFWWALRCGRVHNTLLSANSPSLHEMFNKLYAFLSEDVIHDRSLLTKLALEFVVIWQGCWQYNKLQECLNKAKKFSGTDLKLTGIMGKRTKWQQDEKTQFVVLVTPGALDAIDMKYESAVTEKYKTLLPLEVKLDNDVLLDIPVYRTEDNKPVNQESLSVLDQAIVLACCEAVKSNPGSVELTAYEMLAYLNRIINPVEGMSRSWAVQITALCRRGALEVKDTHLQDRAVLQLENTVFQISRTIQQENERLNIPAGGPTFSDDEVAAFRMQDVFYSAALPVWEIKRMVADVYKSLGLTPPAAELYEELEDWDNVISAYVSMGRKAKAEEIVQKRLKESPEPKLWCYMGEITNDDAMYEKAWIESKETYSKAQRLLGTSKFDKSLWAEAIEHYKKALNINNMFPNTWYALAYAAMQIDDHETACNGFTRTVQYLPDYANAWNNLAACHLKLTPKDVDISAKNSHKRRAFHALDQALKFKRESWKIWENYLVCAMDLHQYGQAMTAMEHIIKLKEGRYIDGEILLLLSGPVVEAVKKDKNDIMGVRYEQLINSLSQTTSTNHVVWEAAARLSAALGDTEQTVMYREKHCRTIQENKGWLEDSEIFLLAVQAVVDLVEAYITDGSKSSFYAAKLHVENTIVQANAADAVKSDVGVDTLRQLLSRIATAAKTTSATPAAAAPVQTSAYSDWV